MTGTGQGAVSNDLTPQGARQKASGHGRNHLGGKITTGIQGRTDRRLEIRAVGGWQFHIQDNVSLTVLRNCVARTTIRSICRQNIFE